MIPSLLIYSKSLLTRKLEQEEYFTNLKFNLNYNYPLNCKCEDAKVSFRFIVFNYYFILLRKHIKDEKTCNVSKKLQNVRKYDY